MTDDLVTEARKGGPCAELGDRCRAIEAASGCFCAAVADRIEALTEKNQSLALDHLAALGQAAEQIEVLTADFALQVQRTDEQREAYEQALAVMGADNARLLGALGRVCGFIDAGVPDMARNTARAALNTGKEPSHD